MIGFTEEYPLYSSVSKLNKGAFVDVKIFGSTSDAALEELTAKTCTLYEKELGIPPKTIYVKYEFATHWGWNGHNF